MRDYNVADVRVLSAVNWPIYSSVPEGGIHPGNVFSDSGGYWFFRFWPSRFKVSAIGIDKHKLTYRIDSRLPLSVLGGLRVALSSKGHDVVIINGSRLGLPASLFLRCSPGKRVAIIDNAMSDFVGEDSRLANLVCRFLLRGVSLVVCHSSEQVSIYNRFLSSSSTKFVFIPYGVGDEEIRTESIPFLGDYVFAGGDAYRDYGTLCTALKGTGIRAVVAAGLMDVDKRQIPQEVQYIGRIGFDRYKEVMARSRIVVVPLRRRPVSQGQLAITQAMGMGKTVVATDSLGTRDYITNGKTGFLVPPRDALALRTTLRSLWNDDQKLICVGEAARRDAQSRFSEERMAQGVLAEIEVLISNPTSDK